MTAAPIHAALKVETLAGAACYSADALRALSDASLAGTTRDARWLRCVCRGLQLQPYRLQAVCEQGVVGELPLAFVSSRLFGRFLVSLPYVNSAGLTTSSPAAVAPLIDEAVRLADRLRVRYLELRHEREIEHARLTEKLTQKVHMRLALPAESEELWQQFHPKVRNQIRKGEKNNFRVVWGGDELLDPFYAVFARNMRDLGTPVYSRTLFREILHGFAGDAELCLLQDGAKPIAGALLVHEASATEVPSASSLHEYNTSCANMLMYWQLLRRAIERQQPIFDFGRSSADSNTYRFKKQWGATAEPAVWQYYLREGSIDEMRPDSPKYRRKIETWRRIPVWLTKLIGPAIVRGIP